MRIQAWLRGVRERRKRWNAAADGQERKRQRERGVVFLTNERERERVFLRHKFSCAEAKR